MNPPAFWRSGGWPVYVLLPLAGVFWVLTLLRRSYYRRWPPAPLPVPVIVVGNLSVGGSGKTPLVVAVAQHLRAAGWHVGIISRGYGGRAAAYPLSVTATTDPGLAGDEPVLLAQLTACPVVVDPKRRRAALALLAQYPSCNVLLSDDGLQHYALPRILEIAVLPETRCGNGHCLPAGPLRESSHCLRSVDMVVTQGTPQPGEWAVSLAVGSVWALHAPEIHRSLTHWRGQTVSAVAGIAAPERFFHLLRTAGLSVREYPFPDHHRYGAADLRRLQVCHEEGYPLLMTAKDAVKWQHLSRLEAWVVPVSAVLAEDFWQQLDRLLRQRH